MKTWSVSQNPVTNKEILMGTQFANNMRLLELHEKQEKERQVLQSRGKTDVTRK